MSKVVAFPGTNALPSAGTLVPDEDRVPMVEMLERWMAEVQSGRVAVLGIAAEMHDYTCEWEWTGYPPGPAMAAGVDLLHDELKASISTRDV